MKKLRKSEMKVSSIGNCDICHKPIIGVHPDEVRMIGDKRDKPVHDDCYFDEFSKELDKHPMGIPRMHR